VSLIIDSHATQFVMSTNTRQLILDVHRTTGHKVCLHSVMMLNKAIFVVYNHESNIEMSTTMLKETAVL